MERSKKALVVSIVFFAAVILPAIVSVISDVVAGQKHPLKGGVVVVLLVLLDVGFYAFLKRPDSSR